MDEISKYIDNSLFIKWVYEPTEDINEYWKFYLEKNPNELGIVNSLKNELQQFRITNYKLNQQQKHQLAEKIFNRMKQERRKNTIHLFINPVLKYAAIIILAVSISGVFFYQLNKANMQFASNSNYTTAITGNGQISKLILPDSSVVWINSGTELKYPTDFGVNKREIQLTGQAFFQVTKNSKMPLKVFCGDLAVKVLGTKFDVCGYPDEKNIDVVLESGKVQLLKPNDKNFEQIMVPGQKVQYEMSTGTIKLSEVDTGRFLKWKEGILVFRDDLMSDVIPKLQRKYNIKIEVDDQEIYKSLFTATVKDETLDEILKSIGFACSVKYKIVNDGGQVKKVLLSRK